MLNLTQKRKKIYLHSNVVLIIACIVASVFYLIQITSVGTASYDIIELREKITDFKSQEENLRLEIARLQSMEIIREKLTQMAMVDVANIMYISIGEGQKIAYK